MVRRRIILVSFFALAYATIAYAGLDAVTPGDRMAMADRLFDKGNFAKARVEYESLKGRKGVAEDELLYRLAECDRSLGDSLKAREEYGALLKNHPFSRHASRSRLLRALSGSEEQKRAELRLLDSDNVATNIRAVALYHLGVMDKSAELLERSVSLDPKGHYAPYAKFQHAAIVGNSADPKVRQQAIRDLNDIIYASDPVLAREAHYIAALRCYSEKRYDLASSLFRRYMKRYPDDERQASARTMIAWSDYMRGSYADAAAICADFESDDAAYLTAMCAYSTGEHGVAREALAKYLEGYPEGRYRSAAELTKARLDFEAAGKGEDNARIIEAAKRSASLSKASGDLLRLAWAYEKAGLDDDALAAYVKVAQDFQGTEDAATALFRKALIDMRASRWAAAELSLAEMLESGKAAARRGEALYWRGMAAFLLDHESEGAKYLEDALKDGLVLDQEREARLMLADWDYRQERFDEARNAYAALVRDGACKRMSAAKIRQVGSFLAGADNTLDAAVLCGRALVEAADSPEWRQAGYILEAQAEERAGHYTAAVEAYRQAFTGNHVRTSDAPEAMLALGILEAKHGEHERAEATLREAVALNAADNARRARAYLWLAKNAASRGDDESAKGYATVVVTLFDDDQELIDEAQKIVDKNS